jgi:hypothetical protein
VDFYMEMFQSLVPEVGYVNVADEDADATRQTWGDFKAGA